MSGGVDSSVTAALLKEQGYDVRGIHIKMWSDPEIPCNFKEDRYDAMRVAALLDIPFETWDFTKEYRESVVEYMVREYAAGRTPNPDVMCNRKIKFGIFLARALAEGADFVATGHYVRAQRAKRKEQSVKLLQARDKNKDQSYFLWTLTQKQLRHCLFPIGEHTKPEVRAMAKKFGLSTAEKPDSQGICFIGEIDLRNFLSRYIPHERGKVLTTSGKTIGEHDGLSFYTLGQRQGIGIGGGIPYYVAAKDYKTNTLIVAEGPYDEKLFSNELTAANLNWISGKAPLTPVACQARVRYRQPLQEAVIESRIKIRLLGEFTGFARRKQSGLLSTQESGRKNSLILNSKFLIRFKEPQRAVTPGQSVVFYQNGEMLGGGIIC